MNVINVKVDAGGPRSCMCARACARACVPSLSSDEDLAGVHNPTGQACSVDGT